MQRKLSTYFGLQRNKDLQLLNINFEQKNQKTALARATIP